MIDEGRIRERIHQAVGYEPPAPSFGTRSVSELLVANRTDTHRQGLSAWLGLAAAVLAVVMVSTLVIGSRAMHLNQSTPATVQTQVPMPRSTFTPPPAVPASNWPPGGPVPAELAGSWLSSFGSKQIDMSGNGYQILQRSSCRPDTGTAWICRSGNVVVNGHEIDFITDVCQPRASNTYIENFGFEKYSYRLTGNTLTIIKATDPGLSNCGLALEGTYTKIAS